MRDFEGCPGSIRAAVTAIRLFFILLAGSFLAGAIQAAPPGTPAPVRPLPLCDRSVDPIRGACVDESDYVDISSSGALSGSGSVQLTVTPRIPACESGNYYTNVWEPSPCYSAIEFNEFGFCFYIDQITGEFQSCQAYSYQDGTTPQNGYAGNQLILTSPELGAGATGTRSGCGAAGDFVNYGAGGVGTPGGLAAFSDVAPTALTCTHSIARTPDNLFGATRHATGVSLRIHRTGEPYSTRTSAGVFYILEGTLGPLAPDPNDDPPPPPPPPPPQDPIELEEPSPTDSGTVRIALTPTDTAAGCVVSNARTLAIPAPPPAGITLPHGGFGFNFSGCAPGFSVEASIQYPSDIRPGSEYYKYDGTRGWFTIPSTISGDTVTFTITDNGPGDLDPADGIIRDPGGIGSPVALAGPGSSVAVPTSPQWALAVLACLMAVLAFAYRRERSRPDGS